jgi:hypothetical protein
VKAPFTLHIVLSAAIVIILATGSANAQTRRIIRFQKMSDFLVSVDSTGWSTLFQSQNWMILKETTGPADSFTVIDVSDPANPQRMSYMYSATARGLPLQTMIPVFLNFNVSNSYTNTHVVNLRGSRMLIAKDSIVRMYVISGSNLNNLASLTIHDSGNQNLNLMLFNDSLLGIQSKPYRFFYYFDIRFNFNLFSLYSIPPWFSSPITNLNQQIFRQMDLCLPLCPGGSYYEYFYYRPYVHGAVKQDMFISYDYNYYKDGREPYWQALWAYGYSCSAYNISAHTNDTITVDMPYANAFNTGHYLSPTENLCTSGFPLAYPYPFEFRPGNVPTELFVATVGNPWPYSTASADNAIYRDTVHRQNQIQNIILDTIARRVYLIFNNNMTILQYSFQTVGVNGGAEKPAVLKDINILPNATSYGVTIVLPRHTSTADLCIYDLSGRVIDRMQNVTSNTVFWKPKTRSMSCYLLLVKTRAERYTKKFIAR